MQLKLPRGFVFIFLTLLVSKSYCAEYELANADLYKLNVYFRKCEIAFFNFNFISIQTAQHYLTSINRPLLIQNGTNPNSKSVVTRYQFERCKIFIAVHNNDIDTLNGFLNLHAFKESNYLILFNLTFNFINSLLIRGLGNLTH